MPIFFFYVEPNCFPLFCNHKQQRANLENKEILDLGAQTTCHFFLLLHVIVTYCATLLQLDLWQINLCLGSGQVQTRQNIQVSPEKCHFPGVDSGLICHWSSVERKCKSMKSKKEDRGWRKKKTALKVSPFLSNIQFVQVLARVILRICNFITMYKIFSLDSTLYIFMVLSLHEKCTVQSWFSDIKFSCNLWCKDYFTTNLFQ